MPLGHEDDSPALAQPRPDVGQRAVVVAAVGRDRLRLDRPRHDIAGVVELRAERLVDVESAELRVGPER